ncbi:MAG: hypothetical protein Q7Q73_10975 [Verrucomicrobiota bacterium JB024]|nr:hypothetical protein [Verrucomicrobiota bacterium JB024]
MKKINKPMNSVRTLLTFTLIAAQWTTSAIAETKPEEVGPTFLNFSGVCQGNLKRPQLWGEAIGWERKEASWHKLEPELGLWDEKAFHEYINQEFKQAASKNVKLLPLLAYTAPWSSGDIPDQFFTLGSRRYEIVRQPDGNFIMRAFSLDGDDESEPIIERNISALRMSHRYLSEDYVGDWEEYVYRVVSALRAEGVEYFQIWNEAYPTSSFWYGNMDIYLERVHIPAAKIIHELGGKVVYGGWPCGAPLSEMAELFDKYDIWETVDIIDIHYFPLVGWEHVYRQLEQRNLTHIGLWQTEIGFTADPNFIGNFYPRALHWALSHDWDYPDKYKLFYFAYRSPDASDAKGYRRCLLLGDELNESGKSLKTLSEILDGGTMSLYEGVTSTPRLKPEIDERLSSMENFRVGNTIVTACHFIPNNKAKIFVDWNEGDMTTYHLDNGNPIVKLEYALERDEVVKVERVSMLGTRIELNAHQNTDGKLLVKAPIREEKPEFAYTDMPEDTLPEVFYVVVTLKDQS